MWRIRSILLLALSLAVGIYGWFGAMGGRGAGYLTGEYTEALAEGQSFLKVEPSPELLAAADPYDPDTDRGSGVLDASFFRGRYYLYYGVVPFLTALVPWFRITGQHLGDAVLAAAYGIGAVLCLTVVLWQIRGRYFPRAGEVPFAAALLATALGSGGLLLTRNARIYEVVIAGAWFHGAVALLAAFWALHHPRRQAWWLGVAAANMGLAFGCRASHAIAMLVVVGFIAWTLPRTDPRHWLGRLLLVLSPLLVIGALQAAFNWVRFGHVFDFGYAYLILGVRNFGASYTAWHYLPFNLWHYLIGLPVASGWFPFFERTADGPLPVPGSYYSLDQVYGGLVTIPHALLAVALAWRWRVLPSLLRPFLLLVAAMAAANLLIDASINGAVYRYVVDFFPHFALLGSIGLLAIAHAAAERRGAWWRSSLVAAVGFVSAASSFCVGIALYDITRDAHPAAFAKAARVFDAPRLAYERWRQVPAQQLRLTLQLPQNRLGHVEPLLVVGRPGLQDFFYVFYTNAESLQVGFESIGRGGPVSDLIPVDYASDVVMDIVWGPELPAAGAWPYGALSAQETRLVRRTLHVTINGSVALDAWVQFHHPKGFWQVGESRHDAAFGPIFSGRLILERVPLPLIPGLGSEERDQFGPVHFAIRDLEVIQPATKAPLVAMGYRNAGQLLTVRRDEAGALTFVVETSIPGADPVSSAALKLPDDAPVELVFRAGGLLPPIESHHWGGLAREERVAARRRVELLVNGQVVLSGVMDGPESGPASVVYGRNSLGRGDVAVETLAQLELLGRLPF